MILMQEWNEAEQDCTGSFKESTPGGNSSSSGPSTHNINQIDTEINPNL